ncbi:hypothetical protein NTE_03237 [Candidatus Nitrososphaera evergladensis SR1]|jgi:hypothetical protein|uniref:Uncharacterized protein n=1 Tax=Candidatus Nitrososphaera evergladensis SR1 TaxID=1459636 RepID=A0A075MUE0_9ARCH|nr:hypothetical protein [Candidatus Nitrososphaera evergladensis]AIF85266.1 hypothetical protein NTE_03237 [Candidatus Nitrososphaera evergladensis SR1]
MDKLESSLIEKQEPFSGPELNIFICENTDGILDPMEQMIYALNELQVSYGSVVILKNAP